MKNKIFILLLLCLVALPIINADVIMPGYGGIDVNNYITNIDNFPNYVFISAGEIGIGMCPIQVIENTGRIGSYYKFCGVFVYAIPKENLNETKIEEMNLQENMGDEEIRDYFNSIGGKEVIKNIDTYEEVHKTSPIEGKNYYYEISLNQVKTTPDRIEILKNNSIYLYVIIPIIAVLIIVYILIKRRK
jgi:hypothetical protein